MKKFDGIELLRKYRDGEIDYNTKIKSLSATGNEYYMYIGRGADKILYKDGKPVSTGYLTNADNEFEIIEEEKDIEELDDKYCYPNDVLQKKINELVREVNKLKNKSDQ